MPSYFPVKAVNRSARIRINGQTITTTGIFFIDRGIVDAPGTPTLTVGAAKSGTLVETKFYAYVVTAVDSKGGETLASVITAIEENKEEGSISVEVATVRNAVGYRLYGSAVAGAASEAAAKAEVLKYITESTTTTLTDTGQARSTATPPTVPSAVYPTGSGGWTSFHELQNHFAIGQLQQLGGYTHSNLRVAPTTTAGWLLTLESEKLKVAAGVAIDRLTGAVLASTPEFSSGSIKSGGAGKIVLAFVVYNVVFNRFETVVSSELTATEPTRAQVEALATSLTSEQEVLYLVQAKVKALTNVTGVSGLLPGVASPQLGDGTNYPAVAAVAFS